MKQLRALKTGPLVAPMISGVSGSGLKLGDHGDLMPGIQSEPIMSTLSSTTAMDQGGARARVRRDCSATGQSTGVSRSPLGQDHDIPFQIAAGISASTAKYQSRYQSGRGVGVQDAGVGRFVECRRPDKQRQQRDDDDQAGAENEVAPGAVGPEWMAGFLQQLRVFLPVGFRIDRFAGCGRLGNAVAQDQPQMQPDEGEDQRGNEKDMNRKKPAQRRAADGVAAQDEPRQPIADERNAPRLFGRRPPPTTRRFGPSATTGR